MIYFLRSRIGIFSLVIVAVLSLLPMLSVRASVMKPLPPECSRFIIQRLRDEHEVYRRVQYGSGYPSVLTTEHATTSDLIPYLMLNYHAFECRLRNLCEAVRLAASYTEKGEPKTYEPIGCSRFFAMRGRWWSDEQRDIGYIDGVIEQCDFSRLTINDPTLTFSAPLLVYSECQSGAEYMLEEERALLPFLASQDSAHRGTRTLTGIFQLVLQDMRNSFLLPLRSVLDLVGSLLYPIPCLVTQCN